MIAELLSKIDVVRSLILVGNNLFVVKVISNINSDKKIDTSLIHDVLLILEMK